MRWKSLVAALLIGVLAACGQGSAPTSEEPVGAAPPPASEPAPTDKGPTPVGPPEQIPPDILSSPAPEPPETGETREEDAMTGTTAPTPGTRAPDRTLSGSSARDRVITPVLVELLPTEQRTPRQNGSAAVLLADPASTVGANKNLLLCQALFLTFDQATSSETQIGVRPGAEGELELLRPIYWLTRAVSPGQPGADRCPQRLDSFDYPRASRIGRKLGLAGAGPYLVIEKHDLFENERVAAVIDLSRTSPDQIANAVRYFRDGFMQAGDVWEPQRFGRARARNDMVAFLGDGSSGNFGFLPRLVHATRQVGCPLTNLLDVCSEPG